jgi:hypothetical protein
MSAIHPVAALDDALAQLAASSRFRVLAVAAILMRDHPRWAVWLPAGGSEWTAVRPAGSRPAPDQPMIWVNAATASELAHAMEAVDQQASSGGMS